MTASMLYLGPYNDPSGPGGRKHWETPHDFDCVNAALLVRKSDRTYSIRLEVRNRSDRSLTSDVAVSFYGVGITAVPSRQAVDVMVADLLTGKTTNHISPPTSFALDPRSIAPCSLARDFALTVGPVQFRPTLQKGVVLVATVASQGLGIHPTLDQTPTLDPCVAVWIGP